MANRQSCSAVSLRTTSDSLWRSGTGSWIRLAKRKSRLSLLFLRNTGGSRAGSARLVFTHKGEAPRRMLGALAHPPRRGRQQAPRPVEAEVNVERGQTTGMDDEQPSRQTAAPPRSMSTQITAPGSATRRPRRQAMRKPRSHGRRRLLAPPSAGRQQAPLSRKRKSRPAAARQMEWTSSSCEAALLLVGEAADFDAVRRQRGAPLL